MSLPNNANIFDILNLASVLLGLQNLSENREQSAHNDVQRENERQAHYILGEIAKEYEELRAHLAKQDEVLSQILRALEEMKKNGGQEK